MSAATTLTLRATRTPAPETRAAVARCARSRRRRRLGGWMLLVVSLAWGTLAQAQEAATPEARDKARAAYARGQQMFDAGRYADAKAAFEEAYRSIPNPVVLLSIAESQERSGEFAGALATLERYLQQRPDAPDRQLHEERIAELKKKPASLRIATEPPGASVILDGEDANLTTPAAIEVGAGRHELVVRRDGYQQKMALLTLGPGEAKDIQFKLEAIAPPAVATDAFGVQPEPAEAEPTPELGLDDIGEAEDSSGVCTGVWISTSVGAAAIVTGSVLGLLALDANQDYEAMPDRDTADRGERLALFADVAFGVGAMSLITALVLYATNEDEQEAMSRTRSFELVSGPGQAGLAARLHF